MYQVISRPHDAISRRRCALQGWWKIVPNNGIVFSVSGFCGAAVTMTSPLRISRKRLILPASLETRKCSRTA